MKTSQSFRIYFTIKSDKEKDGKAPLYVVVTINKEKCFIALKQKMIDTKVWDFHKGAGKGTRDEVKELNSYLDEVKLKLGNCYKELQLKGKLITTQAIKNLFLVRKKKSTHSAVLLATTMKHHKQN